MAKKKKFQELTERRAGLITDREIEIDLQAVTHIAERHGIDREYLQHELLKAVLFFLDAKVQKERELGLEQRRDLFNNIEHHTDALQSIMRGLYFELYKEISDIAGDTGWKSRLSEEIEVLQSAVATLQIEAQKKRKRQPDQAWHDFLRIIIEIYEEGAGKVATPPHWDAIEENYKGAVLEFAKPCVDLIPDHSLMELNLDLNHKSESAIAQSLQKQLRQR